MPKKYKLKRPIERKVRFSEEENEYLNQKIERSPFNNFQNYARILLITGEIKMVDYSELQRLNSEINRIGNNINQLAKFAHQFKEISEADVQELLTQLQSMKQMISDKLKEELKQERLI
ncbi:plasmid mobilization protein [Lactococcus taiwanensis]|uniref:plasmid mobilization protein n=1 Tax=Lactococcus taiwanensis TaxID=1151742 RepID=UPI0035193AF0